MRTASIRIRLLVIAAVVALSVWAIYPPDQTIKLGLDLKGGVHLVLRVNTDEALRRQTQASGTALNDLRRETVQQALSTIERRVNELGVAEPVVALYGETDRILVQLPGIEDVESAKQIIKSTAQLRLTLVEQGPFPSREAALAAYGNTLPPDIEVLPSGESIYYVVQRTPVVSGQDLSSARQSRDEFNRPAVAFILKPDAGARFGAFTERHINRLLATVLDGRVMSVATIETRIDDHGQIRGISRDEMIQQVINLKSGALPADLEYVEEHTVGAGLGEASIRSGVLASVGGLALVALFMLAYYRLTGLNALVSILLNLLILVGLVAFIPVTMTLPGDRRLDPHHRDGRRFERADLRAHQGGARTGARRASGRERRVRSRLGHDRGHPRDVADRGRSSLPVRHEFHSRIRHDPDDRTPGERLYRGVRLEDPVRAHSVAQGSSRPAPEHLQPVSSLHQHQSRLQPLGPARHRLVTRHHWRGRGDDCHAGSSARD